MGPGERYDAPSLNSCTDRGVGAELDPAEPQYWLWNATVKQEVMNYAMGSMDALQNFFFWTWKIANSTQLGYPSSSFWHYKLGLDEGWMPKDPRSAIGFCKSLGVGGDSVSSHSSPWKSAPRRPNLGAIVGGS